MKIALSTGWQPGDSLAQTRQMILRSGAQWIEVHRMTSAETEAELSEWLRSGEVRVSSVHAVFGQYLSDPRYWSGEGLSSPSVEVSERTRQLMFRTLDFAADVGAEAVVFHGGRLEAHAVANPPLADPLSSMDARDVAGREYVDRLCESVSRLLDHSPGVALAIENLRTIADVPSPGELELLLSRFPSGRLGYWHDVAHARAYERMTGVVRDLWLRIAGSRTLGYHIQDSTASGEEHMPLGLGDDVVPWSEYRRDGTFVLEVASKYSALDVLQSLRTMKHELAESAT